MLNNKLKVYLSIKTDRSKSSQSSSDGCRTHCTVHSIPSLSATNKVYETKKPDCNVVERSAGVEPEVNLKNPLQAGDKTHKWGIRPDFEIQGRQISPKVQTKTEVVMAPQNGLMSSEFFLKKQELRIFHLWRTVT